MPAWILKLIGFIPGIGVLEKLMGGNAEAEKIRAQVELVEAEAFKAGRISPRYWIRYAYVLVFVLVVLVTLTAVFFPEMSAVGLRETLKDLLKTGGDVSQAAGW